MTTLIRRLWMTSTLALLLCGCASTGGGGTSKSEALEVAHAAGLKNLRDVSRADYANAIRGRPNMDVENLINVVGVATGDFRQVTNWSRAAEAATLGILGFLESLPTYEPAAHIRFIVWMPVDEARDEEAAAFKLRTIVTAAFSDALPGYRVSVAEKEFGGFQSGVYKYLTITGENCEACGVYSRPLFHFVRKPKGRKAPNILGEFDAYTWGVSGLNNLQFNGFPMAEEDLSVDEKMNILQSVSAALPNWMYIYIAPDDRLTGFPMILHQGQPMLFLEPAE